MSFTHTARVAPEKLTSHQPADVLFMWESIGIEHEKKNQAFHHLDVLQQPGSSMAS